MYQSHWGLKESPFRGRLGPGAFHESPTHQEALARLDFLVDGGYRLGLLVGPSGSGKSLLLEVFAARLSRLGRPTAKISLLDVEPTEMLWLLAAEWGLNPRPSWSAGELWRALGDRLTEYRYQRLEAVVLLDDADQAREGALQHVARLARFDVSPEARLSIVLAARNEGVARLDESLLGLTDLRIEVEPWQRTETERFVNGRLAEAGRETPIFTAPAVDRPQEVSHGIPRRVSQLAELSLLAGAGQNLHQIDAGVVDGIHQELV